MTNHKTEPSDSLGGNVATHQSQVPDQPAKRRSAIGGLLSQFIVPVVTAVVTAAIVTSLRATPNIPDSAAHAFLADYYLTVVNSNQRQYAYTT